jgi:hypothetical protein
MSAPIPISSAVRPAIKSHVRVLVAKRCALIVIVEVSFPTCGAGGTAPGLDLAEGEHIRFDSGLAEGDLDGVLVDRSGLADELVEAPIRSCPVAARWIPRAAPGGFPSIRTRNRFRLLP